MSKFNSSTIEININAPIDTVWDTWTNPKHVVKWNHASEDWHSPIASNELKVGGKFVYRMDAKDGVLDLIFLEHTLKLRKNH